jgi:tetratricopeptide (TPR) repeat protein
MKMIKKLTAIMFLAILFITGCDEYVDINPEATIDADSYFKAPQDYTDALTAAYDLLQTSYLGLWIGEIASDNSFAGGESPNDTEGLHQIDAMTHGGVNNELQDIWRWMYAGITRTNYIFENRDNIEFDGKDKILAQAYFLRAYYYFELVKFFGDVPLIVDKRLGSIELRELERSAAEDVYAQIESDLLAASADGVLDWSDPVKGRITKGSALALLGRVYLYQDKFNDAATVLEKVIDEGPYDLFNDYSTMWLLSNEGNEETVFDIQYVGIEGGGYDCFVCLEGNAAAGFQGIRAYTGPIYETGNSYNLPTQDLVDEFEAGDIRLEASVLDIEAFITANPDEDISYGTGDQHSGYYSHKYIKRADELGAPDTDLTSPLNHRVIRFADVLLMAAEANNRKSTPDDTKARSFLNRVRDRVNLADVTSSGDQLTADIYHERRVELAGEGFHFFDLVRTGRAANEIHGFEEGKNEIFPIPQDEIDLAGAGWIQNPGYN